MLDYAHELVEERSKSPKQTSRLAAKSDFKGKDASPERGRGVSISVKEPENAIPRRASVQEFSKSWSPQSSQTSRKSEFIHASSLRQP